MSLEFPDSVVNLLKSTRFVHLATSLNDFPHVSLMNFTYFSKDNGHYIITTSPRGTTKYENIVSNPNVSLLVHDWISSSYSDPKAAESTSGRRNSLYELLANMNKTELSSVSVMLNGKASILDPNEKGGLFNFYKSLHLNNEKIDAVQCKNYIENENAALILIDITGVKVTDVNDNVTSY